jgi:23S rRNA (guanosine2251-2'-O)-methyltransferase
MDLTCPKYKTKMSKNKEVVLILDNIRSVLNVGSIFRTADAFGISKIYLCGITPSPIDRFGRKRKDLHKTALGAEESVSWEHGQSAYKVTEELKRQKFQVIALEQTPYSKDYKKIAVSRTDRVAIILGSETNGISEEVLKLSDEVAEIPMLGKKESLNVSVSAGIFLARILDI